MKRYDLENFIDDLQTIFSSKLSARIAAINIEKADTLVLDDLDPLAWYFASFDDKVKSFKDFAFYYIDNSRSVVAGPNYSQDVTIEIDLFIEDREDGQTERRFLRLQRCLVDAASDSWAPLGLGYAKPQIESTMPADFKLNNSSKVYKVFGVRISFDLLQ